MSRTPQEIKALRIEEIERSVDLRINAERIRSGAQPLSLFHRSDAYSKKGDLIKQTLKAMHSVVNSSIVDIDISRIIKQKQDGSFEMLPQNSILREFRSKASEIMVHSQSLLTLYNVFSDQEKTQIVTADPAFWQGLVVNANVATGFLERNKEFMINSATGAYSDMEIAPFAAETMLSLTHSTLSTLDESGRVNHLQLGESISKIYNKCLTGEYFDSQGKIKKRAVPGTNLVDDLVEFAGPTVGRTILSTVAKKENLEKIFDFASVSNILKKKEIQLSALSPAQKQALRDDIDFTTEVITGVKEVMTEFLDDSRTLREGIFKELSDNPEVRDKLTDLLNSRSTAEVLKSFAEFRESSATIGKIFDIRSEQCRVLSDSLAKAATSALEMGEYREVARTGLPLLLGVVSNIVNVGNKEEIQAALDSTIQNAGLLIVDAEYARANQRMGSPIDESAIGKVIAEDQRNLASSIARLLSTEENKKLFREDFLAAIRENREVFVELFNNLIEQNTPQGKPRLVKGEEIVDMLSNPGTVEKIIEIADIYLNQEKKGLSKKVIEVLQETPHTKAIAKRSIWYGVKSLCINIYSSVKTSVKRFVGIQETPDTAKQADASLAVTAADSPATMGDKRHEQEVTDSIEARRALAQRQAVRDAIAKTVESIPQSQIGKAVTQSQIANGVTPSSKQRIRS